MIDRVTPAGSIYILCVKMYTCVLECVRLELILDLDLNQFTLLHPVIHSFITF